MKEKRRDGAWFLEDLCGRNAGALDAARAAVNDDNAVLALGEMAILASLERHEIETLSGEVTTLRLDPHSAITLSQGLGDSLYLVRSGLAHALRQARDGRPMPIADLYPGDVWGLESLTGASFSSHWLEPVERQVEFYVVAASSVSRLLMKHPVMAKQVMSHLLAQLCEARELADALASLDVRQRTAWLLARKAKRNPSHCVLDTQENLALQIGSAREVVSKHIANMRAKGLIQTAPGRRGVLVPDPDLLTTTYL